MDYSPKLKKAMAQIKAILEENDIAGGVVLHTPGYAEYLLHISPSYSCAKITDLGKVHFKAKADELPGGKKERDQKLTDTSNMLRLMLDVSLMDITNPLLHLSEDFDEVVGAKHGPEKEHLTINKTISHE